MDLVAVYGPEGDHRVKAQLRRLSGATAEARERGVGFLEVRRQPQAEMFREMAGVDARTFAVVLVCDGAEIARWDDVVDPEVLWRAFDAHGR